MHVTDYLKRAAESFPGKTAFFDRDRSITFSALAKESDSIGSFLAGLGLKNSPVCICIDKSVECVSSMLGVLKSGNYYTVLDTHMPEARVQKVLEVLAPKVIITVRQHREDAEKISVFSPGASVVLYEEAVEAEADEELLRAVETGADEKDIMFVLFTSGSTGVPKGVIISHKAVDRYLKWGSEEFNIDETMILANQAPLYFILTTFDVYMTIYACATCYFMPEDLISFPVPLLTDLKEKKVNTLYWVPSLMCFLANMKALPAVHLDDLRLVLFGGEVMPVKQLNKWISEYPEAVFVNLYGATEITDIITYYVVDRKLDESETLPIGRTAGHMRTMILDEDGREVPEGEIGELCGSGPSLAYGYYRMEEKTNEVFTENPYFRQGDSDDFRKIYHLGDLVRLDERGDLLYVGRKDYQVKHRGNRIELGEIDTAVSSVEGVDLCCCLHDKKRDQLVLFYTGSIEPAGLINKTYDLLPEYMVPTRAEKLEQMPLNLNGKIDRESLKGKI